MIDLVGSDESYQILIFVGVPLLLLLAALIVLLVRGSRRTATFQDLSLTISKVGVSEAYVYLMADGKRKEFVAVVGPGKYFWTARIAVRMPKELSREELQTIVTNTATGMKALRYEYILYREGEPFMIPDVERQQAVDELRLMSFQFDGASNQPDAAGSDPPLAFR